MSLSGAHISSIIVQHRTKLTASDSLAKESEARQQVAADHDSVYDDDVSVSTAYTENERPSLADEHSDERTRGPGSEWSPSRKSKRLYSQ